MADDNDDSIIIRRVEDTEPDTRGQFEKRVFFSPGKGSDFVRFTMYRAKPGQSSDLHVNPGDDCTYVLQGHIRLEADGKVWDVHTGDAFIIRRGIAHKATLMGEEELILITAHCEFCSLFQEWDAKQPVPQGQFRVLGPA